MENRAELMELDPISGLREDRLAIGFAQVSTMNDDAGIDEPVERKLAAIMSADVVGYSRLMGLDEAETVRRLSDLRKVVGTLVEQRAGRIAGTGGDSVLAEFPSVVEAAACAVEIQHANEALNSTYNEDRKMLLRVG